MDNDPTANAKASAAHSEYLREPMPDQPVEPPPTHEFGTEEQALVIEHSVEIDRFKALAHKPGEVLHMVANQSKRALADIILQKGAIFSEIELDGKKVYRFRCCIITPGDKGISFSNQLDQARRQGVLDAAKAVYAQAALVKEADGLYSAPQALALRSVAKLLEDQADVIGKE